MNAGQAGGMALWLAGLAAVMPMAAAGHPAPTLTAAPGTFTPPANAMILTRILRRPLPGGAEIRTERSYEIRIVPDGEGYRVEGVLTGVEVDAPAALKSLAMLERSRDDTGMFPMRLDTRGMIEPVEKPPADETVQEAIRVAAARVRSLDLDARDTARAEAFVTRLEHGSGRTGWPRDLFRPEAGEREETRMIPLPNGARGTVRVNIEARSAAGSGLLDSFVRKVTTDLEGAFSVTEETWTLVAGG